MQDYLFLIDILGDEVVTLDNYKRTLGIPGARYAFTTLPLRCYSCDGAWSKLQNRDRSWFCNNFKFDPGRVEQVLHIYKIIDCFKPINHGQQRLFIILWTRMWREEDAATKFARQVERMKDLFDECDLDESGCTANLRFGELFVNNTRLLSNNRHKYYKVIVQSTVYSIKA